MNSKIQYCFNLTTYEYTPEKNYTLTELTAICKERLQLYRILLEAELMSLKPHTNYWKKYVKDAINTNSLQTYIILLSEHTNGEIIKARRSDNIAHWILSLCKFACFNIKNFYLLFKATVKL